LLNHQPDHLNQATSPASCPPSCAPPAHNQTLAAQVAEQTPLVSLRLGQLALEAGLPPGAVNILPGIGEVAGAALVRHPGIDKVGQGGGRRTWVQGL
jgi:acyl-CoA reductase-like NAD-dependent aldehyde dehydrogenase